MRVCFVCTAQQLGPPRPGDVHWELRVLTAGRQGSARPASALSSHRHSAVISQEMLLNEAQALFKSGYNEVDETGAYCTG